VRRSAVARCAGVILVLGASVLASGTGCRGDRRRAGRQFNVPYDCRLAEEAVQRRLGYWATQVDLRLVAIYPRFQGSVTETEDMVWRLAQEVDACIVHSTLGLPAPESIQKVRANLVRHLKALDTDPEAWQRRQIPSIWRWFVGLQLLRDDIVVGRCLFGDVTIELPEMSREKQERFVKRLRGDRRIAMVGLVGDKGYDLEEVERLKSRVVKGSCRSRQSGTK
jgi:hypothetical protein